MAYGTSPGSPYGGGEAAGSADYFSDAPGQNPEKAVPDKPDEGGETAVLPKSILGGKDFKPGEEVVLKIVRMHDDSVEVSYAPSKPEAPAEPAPGEQPNPGAPPGPGGGGDAEMAALMQ